MKDIQDLRMDASCAAMRMGHGLISWNWSPVHGEKRSTLDGRCYDCGAELQVATNPDTVQGEAIDYRCTATVKRPAPI